MVYVIFLRLLKSNKLSKNRLLLHPLYRVCKMEKHLLLPVWSNLLCVSLPQLDFPVSLAILLYVLPALWHGLEPVCYWFLSTIRWWKIPDKFKNASAFLLRDVRHAMHDILLLRISAILPEAISNGGLTPTTDTDLLLATYRGGSHFTSDIS